MADTVIEKFSSLLGPSFILAYWGPSAVGIGLILGLVSVHFGFSQVFDWWGKRGAAEQVALGIIALLLVTLLAYLLQALTAPLMSLYEGYWPKWFPSNRARASQQRTFQRWQDAHDDYRKYYFVPPDEKYWRPTRLGNTLTAAEFYSFRRYCMDPFIWWPRLAALLPKDFRGRVEASLAPVLTMLNLATIFIAVSLGGGAVLLFVDKRWWLYAATIVTGLLLAWIFYWGAVQQAVNYGLYLRVAFDLHRSKILKQMRIPLPPNLEAERYLWFALTPWLHEGFFPWDSTDDIPPQYRAIVVRPFNYEVSASSPSVQSDGLKGTGADGLSVKPLQSGEQHVE